MTPWHAPIVVHPPAPGGGRHVTVRGRAAGLAHSDGDLTELLRRTGLGEADTTLDDPHLVEWRGAGPHVWHTTGPDGPSARRAIP
ncbi:hypothetical protein G3I40_22420 [Streptomyces sp. SID14478]|uniref:hypothetical protein n=1 Tax=Streptomyces sp. SID14478 TaxID=2706073 RepID=UPI0013DB272C|nr:hypothetical protein [Streptomyces sp. SID14478]NEB77950.1 hypothetical protein [Streptomyces sp. SID14478]